jgi:hypothetical protein
MTMGDQSVKPKVLALLLPADGSEVKLVGYDYMDREDGERNMDAEFYAECLRAVAVPQLGSTMAWHANRRVGEDTSVPTHFILELRYLCPYDESY